MEDSTEYRQLQKEAQRKLKWQTVPHQKTSEIEIVNTIKELKKTRDQLNQKNQQLTQNSKQLEKSCRLYLDLFDFAPEGHFIFDQNGIIVKANSTGCKMLGINKLDVIGKPFISSIHNDCKDEFLSHIYKVLNSDRTQFCEIKLIKKDNTEIYVEIQSKSLTDPEGNIRCISSVSDITERKNTELQLARQREFFESIFNKVPVLLIIYDPNLQSFRLNQHAEEVLGWTTQQANHTDFPQKVFPDENYRSQVCRQMQAAEDGWKEWILTNKDNEQIPIEWANIRLTDETMIGIGIDLRPRKQAEKQLEKQRYFLRKAQEMANIGSWEIDLTDNSISWTPQSYRIFNVPLNSHVDYEKFLSIVHPDDRQYVNEKWKAALAGEPYDIEHRIIVNNNIRWVREKAERQFDSQGKCKFAVGFTQDITDRKVAEQQREVFTQRLTAKTEEMEHFLSVIRHDMGNPLLSVQAFSMELERLSKQIADFIESNNLEEGTHKKLSVILKEEIPSSVEFIQISVKQMNAILEGLRQVADIGRVPVKVRKLDMNKLVKDTVVMLKHRLQNTDVSLVLEDLPACTADPDQTQQIFTNLLTNAIKYRHPQRKPLITISGEIQQDFSIYQVQDNGIGITPQQQEKIFDAFYRVSKQTNGDGLGLTIVSRILERLNGKIWVESQLDQGSTFYVALPRR